MTIAAATGSTQRFRNITTSLDGNVNLDNQLVFRRRHRVSLVLLDEQILRVELLFIEMIGNRFVGGVHRSRKNRDE